MNRKFAFLNIESSFLLKVVTRSLLVLGLVGGTTLSTHGATLNWIPNKTANWTDASAYTENAAPTAGDTVLVTGGVNVMNGSVSNAGFNLQITGGSNTNSNDFYLAKKAVLTLNNTSEASDSVSFTVNSTVRVGGDTVMDGPAILNITAGTMLTKSWFAIGRTEKGIVNINGGTLKATGPSTFIFGDATDAVGELNLSAGVLDVATPFKMGVSNNSSGTFNQTGGTVTLRNTSVEIGSGTGTTATININGSGAVLDILNTAKIGVGSQAVGIINLQNGTLNANTTSSSILVGASAGAKSAELNVSGGTLNATTLNVENSGLFTQSNGTVNASNLNMRNSASAIVSGGTLKVTGTATISDTGNLTISGGNNTIASLITTGSSNVLVTGADTQLTARLNVRNSSVFTIDGAQVTSSGATISNASTFNIIGGGKLTMSGTLRVGNYQDTLATGSSVLNVIDGELAANSWIGHSFCQNYAVINVYSKGKITHKTNIFVQGDGGGTSILNFYQGGTINSDNMSSGGNRATVNFVPTNSGDWNLNAKVLGIDQWNLTFDEVNGFTAFNEENYAITLKNASGTPNVIDNNFWDLSYDSGTKVLSAAMKTDSLVWKNDVSGVPFATFDGGESGLLKLSEVQPDESGNYSFSTFLHGEGDQTALLEFLNDSLGLFTGLDPDGVFTIENVPDDVLVYTGTLELPNYFSWDLGAYNLANGSSFTLTGVPEPATVWLLILGVSGMFFARKRIVA